MIINSIKNSTSFQERLRSIAPRAVIGLVLGISLISASTIYGLSRVEAVTDTYPNSGAYDCSGSPYFGDQYSWCVNNGGGYGGL